MSNEAITAVFEADVRPAGLKLTLVALANYCNIDGETFPGHFRLMKVTSLSRNSLLLYIKTLEKKGYLVDTGKRVGNTKSIKVYTINPTPLQPDSDKNEAVPNPDVAKMKQCQIQDEAVPNPEVSSAKSNESPTPPIKKEPYLTNKEPRSNKSKSIVYSLGEWEEKINGKPFTAADMQDWLHQNRISRPVANKLIDSFRDKLLSRDKKYTDFRAAFRTWLREGWLCMTMDQAVAASKRLPDGSVTFYDRGLNL